MLGHVDTVGDMIAEARDRQRTAVHPTRRVGGGTLPAWMGRVPGGRRSNGRLRRWPASS
jgi:hypothetical protein